MCTTCIKSERGSVQARRGDDRARPGQGLHADHFVTMHAVHHNAIPGRFPLALVHCQTLRWRGRSVAVKPAESDCRYVNA
jgi:hypothetical protein